MDGLVISSGTVTCLAVSAALCVALPFIIWIYMWGRVRFIQAVFGFLFSCAVVLLENLLDAACLTQGGAIVSNAILHTVYLAASMALLQTIGFTGGSVLMRSRYETADAAVGFAVGFAAMELFVGGVSNVISYALAMYCNKNGIEAMAVGVEPEYLQSMLAQLQTIADTDPVTYLLSGFNRVAYTIQMISLGVLSWFAVKQNRLWLLPAAILAQTICRLPYGLYTAGRLTDFLQEEVATYILSAAFAAGAGLLYNRFEPKTYKYKAEKLRTRRRR